MTIHPVSKSSDGLCKCGCGQRTSLWPQTYTKLGIRKGDPRTYIKGHRAKRPPRYASCHPDRLVKGRGLCGSCYNKKLLEQNPEARMRLNTRQKARWRALYSSGLGPEHAKKQRDRHLRHRYGISAEEHEALLTAQNGLCALCKQPGGNTRTTKLQVDHCHRNGNIRELLCPRCNHIIGMLEYVGGLLPMYTAYIKRHASSAAKTKGRIRCRNKTGRPGE